MPHFQQYPLHWLTSFDVENLDLIRQWYSRLFFYYILSNHFSRNVCMTRSQRYSTLSGAVLTVWSFRHLRTENA